MLASLEGLRFEADRIRGSVCNASGDELESVRLVYLRRVRAAGAAEPSVEVFCCDVPARIAPGDRRRFECQVRPAEGEVVEAGLRILSTVVRTAAGSGTATRAPATPWARAGSLGMLPQRRMH